MGGVPHIERALISAFIDIAVTILTMLMVVEQLLPKYFYRGKYSIFFILFFLLVFISGTAIILLQLELQGSSLASYPKNISRYKEHYFYWFWADLIFGSYFLVFFVSATGGAIRLAFDRLKAVNDMGKLEKEKKGAELESLKNQINPHFLFNALNTIYYKIERSNTGARETLQGFAEMLRYQLYDCNKELVPVEEELRFLRSYIELQKARLNKNYTVNYEGFDTSADFSISPFLLMPLIENCFKYVSNYTDKINSILIKIKIEGNNFYLETFNTCETKSIIYSGGIGLQNVQKRLQLLYPGRHELNIHAEENSFAITLKIEWL
jgi:two-component system, LytTR family, sensor kinase